MHSPSSSSMMTVGIRTPLLLSSSKSASSLPSMEGHHSGQIDLLECRSSFVWDCSLGDFERTWRLQYNQSPLWHVVVEYLFYDGEGKKVTSAKYELTARFVAVNPPCSIAVHSAEFAPSVSFPSWSTFSSNHTFLRSASVKMLKLHSEWLQAILKVVVSGGFD